MFIFGIFALIYNNEDSINQVLIEGPNLAGQKRLSLPSDDKINGIVDIINQVRRDIEGSGLSATAGGSQNILPSVPNKAINSEQVVSIINHLRGNKNALIKTPFTVSKDHENKNMKKGLHLVNSNCSSHLSRRKSDTTVDDEKVGQKRVNKEELTRGHVSGSSEDDSEEEGSKEKKTTESKSKEKVHQKKNSRRKRAKRNGKEMGR